MGQALHLKHFAVDQTSLAGLCRRCQVRELSIFRSDAWGEMRPGVNDLYLSDIIEAADYVIGRKR